jgi:hypothetical protein
MTLGSKGDAPLMRPEINWQEPKNGCQARVRGQASARDGA